LLLVGPDEVDVLESRSAPRELAGLRYVIASVLEDLFAHHSNDEEDA